MLQEGRGGGVCQKCFPIFLLLRLYRKGLHLSLRSWIGSMLQEEVHDLEVPLVGSGVERCPILLIGRCMGASGNQSAILEACRSLRRKRDAPRSSP